MADNFLTRATAATRRGLKVVPLRPAQKVPVLDDWPQQATRDEARLAAWAQAYPDANCGAVADAQAADGTWILDVDSPVWFLDACPTDLPDTFVVRTGGGGLQLHFKHDANSRAKLRNRAVPNPNKGAAGEKENLLEVLWDRRQGLVPGCVHPTTGQTYEVFRDRELTTASPRFIDWLLTVTGTRPEAAGTRYLNPLRAGWEPEAELAKAGLRFKAEARDGKVYLNYHVLMGRCLVKGDLHEPNRTNNRCCAFVYRPDTRELWHQCFAGGCDPVGSTAKALAALGLALAEVTDRGMPLAEALKAFKTYDTLDATPLTFLVDGFLPEEGITGLAGLSGHYKTWLSLSLAKALILGTPLWGTFKVLGRCPVMYLIPESGDRSLRHRLGELRGAAWAVDPRWFVCRTFSEGLTLGPRAPEVLAVAVGRVVFLDTTIRFVEGDESSASDNQRGLAADVLGLLTAGARAVVILHHAPKAFRQESEMYLENVFRGTGDIGAMLAAAYGVRALDDDVVHVECLKDRDFQGPGPFQLKARPSIHETGDFTVHSAVGSTGPLEDYVGRRRRDDPRRAELTVKMRALKAQGKSDRDIAKLLQTSRATVGRYLAGDDEGELF